MRKQQQIIHPDLTMEEAQRLVMIIKNGSVYAGTLVIKSLANTLRYVTYRHPDYSWKAKKNINQKIT